MLQPNTVPVPSTDAPTPTQSNSVQQPLAAPAQGTLPTSDHILSMVAKKMGTVAQGAASAVGQAAGAVQDGVGAVGDAVGNAMGKPAAVTFDNNSPQADMMRGQNFAAKFKNVPTSIMAIEPAIGRASKAFGVPTDALAYTLMSENAKADPNPAHPADPNDHGMFQVNKLNEPMVSQALKSDFGIKYDPSNPNHSALAAAVVLNDTQSQLAKYGIQNVSPKDLSVAYRMGPTNYSVATRGTDLNGNKAKPAQVIQAKQEYDARIQDLTQNTNELSTAEPAAATGS